jgi:hypothetical protein
MTPLLPELEAIPVQAIFDGELIAFAEGEPDFLALTERMLLAGDLVKEDPVAFLNSGGGRVPATAIGYRHSRTCRISRAGSCLALPTALQRRITSGVAPPPTLAQ